MSEHELFFCVERERDEAIRERDEARKEVASLTEGRQRLLTTVRGAFKKLRRLRDIWRDTENDGQRLRLELAQGLDDAKRLLLELAKQRDEARKDRDGWRMSEQETSREYHELRELNAKVRGIMCAPYDVSTDDAVAVVVQGRDRWYAEVQRLTAERKEILDQRDEARQQRDEAQKLAVERGEQIECLKHDLKHADAGFQKTWEHRDALASRFRSIDRVLGIYPGDAEETLQAVQKVVHERDQAVRERDDLREQWVSPRELAKSTNTPVRRCARSRVPLDGAEAQALEGALALTERERDDARSQRDEACSQRDQAREQSSKLAEELERTKTLLAEDRAELKELRDRDQKTAEELSHVTADLSASHSLVDELRAIVGAGVADATRDVVRRVVAERDELRDRVCDVEKAKVQIDPPLLLPGLRWVWMGATPDLPARWEACYESLIVGRVERCSATSCTPAGWRWQRLDGTRDWGIEDDEHAGLVGLARHLREHPPLVAADPAEPAPAPELPPWLRWVRYDAVDAPSGWYVQMTDGSNKMVGRVDQSIPPNGGSRGWRWQRLGQPVTGRPTWGDTPTEYEARAALARYLCAVVTDAKLPADAFTLPLGMHWRRVGTVVMQVTDDRGHVVGEVVPGVPPGWSWWASGGPAFAYSTGGVAPSEFDARDALAAAVREAHGPSEQADAPASPEHPPSAPPDSTDTSLPKGLFWARVGEGPWVVHRRLGGEPLGRAWYDEQQKGWRWEFAKSGNGEGFFSTAWQARSRLAAHLRQRGPSSRG
jgi:hypothetical protein